MTINDERIVSFRQKVTTFDKTHKKPFQNIRIKMIILLEEKEKVSIEREKNS